MREGDIALRLKLRDGDHFGEVADAINGLLDNYQGRIARVQAMLAQNPQLSPEQQRELAEQLSWFTTEQKPKA